MCETHRLTRFVGLPAIVILLVSCGSDGVIYSDLRIYSSPYSAVDWATDVRLLAQHHDHFYTQETRIQDYDAAGYNVLSLMDYSGNPDLPYALQQRMWPPEQWVPTWVLSDLESIQFLIPGAEEVGIPQHGTSPFLTSYIEGDLSFPRVVRRENTYASIPEMFEVVRSFGGFPCIAHPWTYDYSTLEGSFCAEVYTAYAEAQKRMGREEYVADDHNEALVRQWDKALHRNQRIIGIAVNDHYGPYAEGEVIGADIVDSGKIEVLAKAATADAYRAAFESGAVLAIRDMGVEKGLYPVVTSVAVGPEGAFIETLGDVTWIANGVAVKTSSTLRIADLPPNSRYIRAEVRQGDGSVVYLQPFVIRPVGDIDGDYDIDDTDSLICAEIEAGTELNLEFVLACGAVD